MIAQFALRLLCGISLTWLVLPRSQITPGFFRIQSLLALALGALSAITVLPSVFVPGPETPLVPLFVARGGCLGAGALAYLSSIFWTLGRRRAGTACLFAVALLSTSTLLLGSLPREVPGTGLAALTVFSELATSLTIGGAMVGMLLGHWYLTSPTMSIAPLSTTNVYFASAAGLRFLISGIGLAVGWQSLTDGELGGTPLMWLVLRWLAGIVAPLVLALMVWRILRYRNTQAATGVLFVGVIVTFIGELSATLVSRELHLPL
jgi:hypothetical protein